MAWRKVGRYGVARGGPSEVVRIPKACRTISFGTNAGIFWKLDKYKSANVYSDPDKPQVIGIELVEDETGDRSLLGSPGWLGKQIACSAVLAEKEAKPGLYYAHRDKDTGYIVIDLDSTYP